MTRRGRHQKSMRSGTITRRMGWSTTSWRSCDWGIDSFIQERNLKTVHGHAPFMRAHHEVETLVSGPHHMVRAIIRLMKRRKMAASMHKDEFCIHQVLGH